MRAWIGMDVEPVLLPHPGEIGEAGRVVEQNAQGERGGVRIAFEVSVRGELAEGLAGILSIGSSDSARRAGRGA